MTAYLRTTNTGTTIICVPRNSGVWEFAISKRALATPKRIAAALARAEEYVNARAPFEPFAA